MQKNESYKFKQLSLLDRTKLQSLIETGNTASEIANELQVSRQTIYREIRRHLLVIPPKQSWNLKTSCIHYGECFFNVPQKLRHCDINCPKYQLKVCDKLNSFPFICNKCGKRALCTMTKQFYYCDKANQEAKENLSDARQGIRKYTSSEFNKIDNLVYDGIKKGQSIEHIVFSNPDVKASSSQIRLWINQNIMKTKRLDLRLATKYNTNKYQPRKKKFIGKNPKLEHRYEDFLLYIKQNKGKLVTEVDTVMGKKGDKKCLLTILIKKYHFQFAYLLNDKTSESVNNAFLDLINKVGKDLFQKVFGIILTDNGSEFDKLRDIEIDNQGEVLTQVFYCHAYTSQEKGSCENNHRLIRYIKDKGVSLDSLTQDKVNLMFSHINSLARGSLSGYTPYESIKKDIPSLTYKLGISKINPNEVTLTQSLLD